MSQNISHQIRSMFKTRVVAVSLMIICLFFWPIAAFAQIVLSSGQTHIISPADTECVTDENGGAGGLVIARCDAQAGAAVVFSSDLISIGPFESDFEGTATVIFKLWFSVEPVNGVADQSLVPIHVRLPAAWTAEVSNSHLSDGGFADVSILLQLRKDPESDPNLRGQLIERKTVATASHGGSDLGCLSIPTGVVDVVNIAIVCASEAVSEGILEFGATSEWNLNAIVKVGETYNLELELRASARSLGGPLSDGGVFAQSGQDFDSPGVKWTEMVVTIGTDPAVLLADLQEQIGNLREALKNHTHNYLTGRGQGHNNTLAVSSPAILPGASTASLIAMPVQAGPTSGSPTTAAKKTRGKKTRN